ncbi:TetR/AcrR family transcriptional regulator [Aetokthonos hydrillicola Thurmond2011]|jgi:AcrR family transcriptional regulator|uniref:TetR/AcrR family transcriptional regulator n=1 Tax=Aetokthonos hydrillicola Thurmond2011 TaxID=2712845 RepID=A0AAP5M7M9_9CYAN|nr:TetR/AcrR family transcriptional regulator [Aetokthonos hydrillicola]MBO3459197.1 TetR/AcrR family transcriptional regulator [Aetokthonos hydrillicola CCALA 1050]MBW4584156.1 TetR/AcrR family transcriptional regulator [Aetokthonos hydrillicola CCALA 1050]MDR9898311.1 TetR/AcrR family transcriptional regulator [Aetokthonos hydrillicola Thurmond2011]
MKPTKAELLRPDSEKAETILAGARQEFMERGYAAASMDRIANAAKVSKPTLYSYFQDKEGLFTALIEQLSQGCPQELLWLQNPHTLEEPPDIVLQRLATKILEQFTGEQPLFFLIRIMIGESGRFPSLAKAFISKFEKQNIHILTEYLTAHPQISLPDPEMAARIFMGTLIHHIITHEILHGRDVVTVERDRLIESLVTLIVKK